MSDNELRALRRKRLQELKRRMVAKQEKPVQADPDEVLNTLFKGRAWEVFAAASSQYPGTMQKLRAILANLALSGKLKEVSGEQLYHFLRKLGLRVKLNTRILYKEDGNFKSLSEKIKEDLHKT